MPIDTGDNGLVESKNGAVDSQTSSASATSARNTPERSISFIVEYLNPYVNFHRPCAVPQIVEQPNGKRRRVYRAGPRPSRSSNSPALRELPAARCQHGRTGTLRPSLNPIPKPRIEMQRAKRQMLAAIAKRSA